MDLVISGQKEFNIERILECGQCFHFVKLDEMDYALVHRDRLLHISQRGNDIIFHDTDRREYERIWAPYFGMDTDYDGIRQFIMECDPRMEAPVRSCCGIRILRQEFFETLISFIISQNKQIPHIKKIVAAISEKCGKYLGTIDGNDMYSFPGPAELVSAGEEMLRELKTGFRAPYIMDAAKKVCSGEITERKLLELPYEGKLSMLTSVYGVGEKVANCVILFSLNERSAFPIDVWIKRIMEEVFFDGQDTKKDVIKALAAEKFGEYGGYAQQYLFDYGRNMK